jgi:Protein of unknown function (DUF3572)
MPIRARPKHQTSPRGDKYEKAKELAIAAFGFLAADSRLLSRFLETAGIEVSALREATKDPDFLAGVLDHVCGEEDLLLAFATESGIEPTAVTVARDTLGGHPWELDAP